MAQPRRRPRLALEPSSNDALARQKLDRDVALEALITGEPDGPEPAGAEPTMEAVTIEDDRPTFGVLAMATAAAVLDSNRAGVVNSGRVEVALGVLGLGPALAQRRINRRDGLRRLA